MLHLQVCAWLFCSTHSKLRGSTHLRAQAVGGLLRIAQHVNRLVLETARGLHGGHALLRQRGGRVLFVSAAW